MSVFKKQCVARCAVTGLRCGLLQHDDRVQHRTARGEFRVVAAAGQEKFPLAALRDDIAVSQSGSFDPIAALREAL